MAKSKNALLARQRAVSACLDRFDKRPRQYGSVDCVKSTAFVLRKARVKIPMLKGKTYGSRGKAAKLLEETGYATLVECLDALGLERIAPLATLPGDILALPVPEDDPFGRRCSSSTPPARTGRSALIRSQAALRSACPISPASSPRGGCRMAEPVSATFAAIGAAVAGATAATATALTAIGLSTTAAAVAAKFVVNTAINVGLSLAASALLAPSVNAGGSPTDWRPDPNAGFPVVLGRAATAGSIIHMDEHGEDNRYLTTVNLLSVGPIDALESFRADRVAVTFSNGQATSPSDYAAKMWQSVSLGPATQTSPLALASLAADTPGLAGWGSGSVLPGLAHTLWTLYQDSKFKSYPQGAPDPLHIVRGVKVYDPRKDSTHPGGSGSHRLDDPDTWEFSKNPGLHAIA
ncbi:MAG: DUF6950 family protein [Oceanicaulis sp.]